MGSSNGAAFGGDVVDFTKDTKTATNTGQFIAAISVAAFAEVETFKAQVDAVFEEMRDSTPLPGHGPLRIPGEGRGSVYQDRKLKGIPFHPNLVNTLKEIAGELQIAELRG